MKPHRMRLAHHLILAYGLYRQLEIYRPSLLAEDQLTMFHTDDYVHFLQHVNPGQTQHTHSTRDAHTSLLSWFADDLSNLLEITVTMLCLIALCMTQQFRLRTPLYSFARACCRFEFVRMCSCG